MPSPFPGMDPWLEKATTWGGVHMGLLYAIHAALNRDLPEGLYAELDQYLRVEEGGDDEVRTGRRNPDVFVPEPPPPVPKPKGGRATAVLDPPTVEVTLLAGAVQKHRRVLIRTLDGRQVLTAIELLSPSNKNPGPGRNAYLAKRNEYLASGTNLVEIDLLRDGDRLPLGRPRPPISDYYIVVSPAPRRPQSSVWSFSVREPIPVFPVPLGPEWDAVPLALRGCMDRLYDEGRYAQKVRYANPPEPPLREPDAAWAADLLKKPARKKK
jgi:hypothetical protein